MPSLLDCSLASASLALILVVGSQPKSPPSGGLPDDYDPSLGSVLDDPYTPIVTVSKFFFAMVVVIIYGATQFGIPGVESQIEGVEAEETAEDSGETKIKRDGPLLFPPYDKDSPSFHFWTIVIKNQDIAGAMRNGGKFPDDPSEKGKVSLIVPRDPKASAGRPAKDGYRYDHSQPCMHDATYGGWVRLDDDCRARLLRDYTDASNLDEKLKKMKADKKKFKDVSQVIPDPVEGIPGGPELQLPISIDEYFYYNPVQNRMPFGLEKGFQIIAKCEDEEKDEWSGRVGHLDGQQFWWRRRHPDMPCVQFGVKDWMTWETNIKGLIGTRRIKDPKEDKIEFPTTHLWVDLDKYELVWFYGKRAVARKAFYIPFFLKGPLDFSINWAVKKSIKGEAEPD
ncbi:hypothetical protein TrVE_jg1147 [Triparma verrucosa]|uniref:Uncharacterized protein n=1 Tax=Triparma verrucosa TaxID=1606542 RepID=A0A9W7FLM2_9STRA|nr:hypothetical protein TrVE_jg1147 [Triparma verrucosa]